MFKQALVPLDGSPLAEEALPTAVAMARLWGGSVVLLHAIESAPPRKVHGQPHLAGRKEARDYVERIVARCRAEGIPACGDVADADGGAAKAIADAAAKYGVDSVVMVRHGVKGVRGLVRGWLAEQVLARSGVPVLAVRPEPGREESASPAGFRRILVPHDLDARHGIALDVAMELAQKCEAEVRLLAVVPTWSVLMGLRRLGGIHLPGLSREMLRGEWRQSLSHLQGHLSRMGGTRVPLRADVVRGDVSRQIARAAEAFGADLVVLASHGKAGTAAFWAGSTAARVCARVRAPVLLLPAGVSTECSPQP